MTSYTVSAAITFNSFGGGQLYVLVLNNATMAVTPATGTSTTAYNCSVTTTADGSIVVGALSNYSAPTAFTAESNTTITQYSDATNDVQYAGFYSSATTGTPGATTFGSSTAFDAAYGIAAVEVVPAGAGNVTVDASSPAAVQSATTTTPFTTASFSPPGGTLLVAILAPDGNTTGGDTIVATVTSSPALTWTQQVSVNSAVSSINGYVGVWTAVVPNPSPVVATTSLNNAAAGNAYSFTLAATSGTPAYTWSISSGSLPGWASLASSTGIISGTPAGTDVGTTTFTVQVTDSNSLTGTQVLSLSVVPATASTGTALPSIPGLSTPGADTPGDPGPGASGPTTGPVFYPAVQPVRARVAARMRLAGVYMGVSSRDLSFGTGQIQWNSGGPVVNPHAGPVFVQKDYPQKARLPLSQFFPRGRIAFNEGAPVSNPVTTVLTWQKQAIRAKLARSPFVGTITAENARFTGNISGALNGGGFGNGIGCNGAPVNNPTSGPVFRQATQPIRTRIPQNRAGGVWMGVGPNDTSFGTGQVQWSSGAPVQNPVPPGVPQRGVPVRAPLPPLHPRAGRIGSSFGAVVVNPAHGPPVYPLKSPVQARFPQLHPRAGRVESNPGAVRNPAPGPVVYALQGPVRVRIPQLQPCAGRTASSPGAPRHNPTAGPVFRAQGLIRARQPEPPRGTCRTSSSVIIIIPSVPVTPFASRVPVRAVIPQTAPRGRVSGNKGAPVRNPGSGPVFRQATSPIRIRVPQTFSKGRIGNNAGAPVHNPGSGPAFRPQGLIRPQPAVRSGGLYGDYLIPPVSASYASISYNTGSNASAITAGSVNVSIPAGVLVNDLMVLSLALFTEDATAPALSFTGGAWTLANVTTGTNPEVASGSGVYSYGYAYYRIATSADPNTTLTISESGSSIGTTWWGAALGSYTGAAGIDVAGGANAQGATATVTTPGETTSVNDDWAVYLGGGAPGGGANWTYPAGTTERESVVSAAGVGAILTDSNGALPSGSSIGGGTFGSSAITTTWLTAFTLGVAPQSTPGAPVTQAAQYYSRQIAASYGAPVNNPAPPPPPGVVPPLQSPVRSRIAPPRRGRIAANFGSIPVVVTTGPVFVQKPYPARIRPSLPPRGRITFNKGAVKNPTAGPVFRQADHPVRAVIPQTAARGIYAGYEPFAPVAPVGAITYNTGTSATADTAASVSLTIPPGVLPGDAMFLAVTCFTESAVTPAVSFLGGGGPWSLIGVTTGTNPEIATAGSSVWSYGFAYYRIANSDDPGASLTISETGSSGPTTWWGVALASYTGAAGTGTIDVAGGANAQGGAFTTVTCPPETTNASGDWAVYLCPGTPGAGASFTIPAGSTQREAIVSDAGIGAAITDSNGSAGNAGTSIGGGTFGATTPTEVWLTAFTVGLAAPVGNIPRQQYSGFYATGRTAWSPGAAAENPQTPGPPVYPLKGPVQAKALPRRRGICRTIKFIPLGGNPTAGPQFYNITSPVQAKLPKPFLAGRIEGNPGIAGHNPTSGPVFRSATQPAKARQPLPPRGRISRNTGAPVKNQTTGPVFRQATQPARIRTSLPKKGRVGANFGAPFVPSTVGPPFRQATSPIGARIPQNAPRGRVYFNAGAPVHNPGAGPVFRQANHPIAAKLPYVPKGRIYVTPLLLARVPGAVTYPLQGPVRSRIPQVFPRGRIGSNPGGPVFNPPPKVYPLRSPVRIHPVLPPRGRIAFLAGVPTGTPGPVFTQKTFPCRTRITLPPRGRITSNKGAPVITPSTGPVFRQATSPARTRITLPRRGRIGANFGALPVPSGIGPVFIQKPYPARVHPILPPRGRIGFGKGAPVQNPPVPPVVYPLEGPVQARFPLPLRGRVYSHKGAPVVNPPPVAYPLQSPVQARFPLPPRGRVSSNKGAPVHNPPPPVYPLKSPVRAQNPPRPMRGRVILGNKGAPVVNPHSGPVFRQAVHPIRSIIPQNAPRGRTNSNPGGPVMNPSGSRAAIWNSGQTYTRWTAGSPYSRWQLGQPYTRNAT